MVKLFCAIVGAQGSAFPVEIDAGQFVGDLKKAIKNENEDITCPARKLQLFLAKKDDGWLPSTHLAALQGSKANIPVSIERVPLTDATWSIQDVLKENKLPDPQTRQIHVVVVVPELPDGRKRFRSNQWFAESSQPLKKRRVGDGVSEDASEDASEGEDEDMSEERTFFEMRGFPPLAHPMTEYEKIMERKAYIVIFAQLVEHVKSCFESGQGWKREPGKDSNVVVTGNPGIGKSRFYLYCIFQLIRNQEREDIKQLPPYELVLNFKNEFHKYDAANAEFMALNEEDVRVLMAKPRVLRLIEAKSTELEGWRGVSVLFASPGVKGLNDFEKVNGFKFIMPTWSLGELKECNSLLPDDLRLAEEELVSRYDTFGGIPRFVFSENKTGIEEKLNSAIASFSAFNIISYSRTNEPVLERNYSHCVLKMVPTEDNFFAKYHLDFLSLDIAHKVIGKMQGEVYVGSRSSPLPTMPMIRELRLQPKASCTRWSATGGLVCTSRKHCNFACCPRRLVLRWTSRKS